MTTTAPDVDVIAHLDWQLELPCEADPCNHDRPPARWRVFCPCRCALIECDPCVADLRIIMDRIRVVAKGRGVVVQCRTCRAVNVGQVDDLIRVETL